MTPEQRLAAFKKMVEQRPKEPFARYSLAMAHRSLGQGDEAARQLDELALEIPGYVPTYLMWGQVLEALGRPGEAAGAYRRGIGAATQANDEHARSELGQALELLQAQGAR
ncbi:MAG TPA: hypothetical protein VF400_15260 [Anaeromyxobacteraceae bacterium]